MNKLEQWAGAIKKHEGWFSGSASQRNNNPGNFRCSALVMGELGAIKCVNNLAVFPSYDIGWEALKTFLTYAASDQLRSYKSTMTLLDFYKVYAPSEDKNNPLNYASAVAKDLGVSIDTKIKDIVGSITNVVLTSKELIYPIDKVYITQKFGENPQIYKRFGMNGHNGIDFRTKFWDSPLGHRYTLASKDGKVIEAKFDAGYGWMVRLEHDLDGSGNEQTVYGHHSKLYVKVRDNVKQGQKIALTDNTGFSTGSHLHFGYRSRGWKKDYNNGFKGYIDPLPILKI